MQSRDAGGKNAPSKLATPISGFAPTVIVTDKLRCYGAALQVVEISGRHEQGSEATRHANDTLSREHEK
jgi:hypothetical protein